jgi:hypothetical protein
MKIAKHAKHGLSIAWRSKGLMLLFFVANLSLGWLAVRPLDRGLEVALSRSTWSDALVERFDYTFLIDFARQHPDVLPTTGALAVSAALLYFFVNLFLVGGAIGTFHSPEFYRGAAGAFAAGGAYFGRMFRLLLWEIPFFILLIIGNLVLSAAVTGMAGNPPSEATILIGYVVVYLLLFGLFLLIDMIFDYGKIRAVVEDERRGRRNMMGAMRFVFRNFGATSGLYGLLFLLGVVLMAIYLFVSELISATTTATIFLLVAVQQLFILSRIWLKLAFLGGQLSLYQAAQPTPPPVLPTTDQPETGALA